MVARGAQATTGADNGILGGRQSARSVVSADGALAGVGAVQDAGE